MHYQQFDSNQNRKDEERRSNEWASMKKTNADLSDALSKTMEQQDIERMTVNVINEKIALVQAEKESIEKNLRGSNFHLNFHIQMNFDAGS